MAVVPNPEPDWYGGVAVDARGWVTGFPRRGQGPGDHFIGVQVVRKEAFAGVARGDYAESVGQLYPRLIAARPGSVRAFRCDATFRDVGTSADYLKTCLEVANAEDAPGSLTASARIAEGARVVESVLWDDVTVQAGAEVTRSVVGSGVRIPAGSVYHDVVVVAADGREPLQDERLENNLLVAPLARRARSR
jgi:NDP-sugar pyrophosphorylase family protein